MWLRDENFENSMRIVAIGIEIKPLYHGVPSPFRA
jgi:hypothetical protein